MDRLSFRALLAASAALGVAAAAASQCQGEGECADVEESALLQTAGQWGRKDHACEHGGYMEHGYCKCNEGWTGDKCDVPEEVAKEPRRPDNAAPGEFVCNQGFTVYPYAQPELWGTRYDGWEDCAGDAQSPIRLSKTRATDTNKVDGGLETDYANACDKASSCEMIVSNTGSTLKVPGEWGTLKLNGVTFFAEQFHFHTPSEHTHCGFQLPMELHMVHATKDRGQFAVVGIFFQVGVIANKCLTDILGPDEASIPNAGCKKKVPSIDFGECFAKQLKGNWYSYSGSLTTPPCSEGINWNVMDKKAYISFQQLRNFRSAYVLNARPVQKLGKRELVYNKAK